MMNELLQWKIQRLFHNPAEPCQIGYELGGIATRVLEIMRGQKRIYSRPFSIGRDCEKYSQGTRYLDWWKGFFLVT
jgi:hypothetical protein